MDHVNKFAPPPLVDVKKKKKIFYEPSLNKLHVSPPISFISILSSLSYLLSLMKYKDDPLLFGSSKKTHLKELIKKYSGKKLKEPQGGSHLAHIRSPKGLALIP